MTEGTEPMAVRLPVLSLWRPWPALIFQAGKDVENRTWRTFHRGDLLIAAAGGLDGKAIPAARGLGCPLNGVPADPADHPTGIVGVVELYDVCTYAFTHRDQRCDCSGWAQPNQMHWQIRNPRLFPQPVPHMGKQRLWAVRDQVWPAVAAQLEAADRQPAT
jgi:hypothetical protein